MCNRTMVFFPMCPPPLRVSIHDQKQFCYNSTRARAREPVLAPVRRPRSVLCTPLPRRESAPMIPCRLDNTTSIACTLTALGESAMLPDFLGDDSSRKIRTIYGRTIAFRPVQTRSSIFPTLKDPSYDGNGGLYIIAQKKKLIGVSGNLSPLRCAYFRLKTSQAV